MKHNDDWPFWIDLPMVLCIIVIVIALTLAPMTNEEMEQIGIKLTPAQRHSWNAMCFCAWAILAILVVASWLQ